MITTVLIPVVIGLVVNEFCDVSPWLARKIVRWSAFRRYTDPARAEARAEELAAIINERPGKLLKLITAIGFSAAATMIAGSRALSARARPASKQNALKAGGHTYLITSPDDDHLPQGLADLIADHVSSSSTMIVLQAYEGPQE